MTIGRHASAELPAGDASAADLPAQSSALDNLTLVRAPESGVTRVAKAIGFHLGVVALFTVPAIVLWWHVWSGHPANTLTCACGDPAQEVWFIAWPAWAIAHLHNPFFSSLVNVPHGANLLSNTSGTLVGVVLAPVTWMFGPVAATNVALTLAPALSAWGCFVAIRPLVTWKWGALPAAFVFGYSSAVYSSLLFGHVSIALLVFPPLLFSLLHEIVIRQEHSVRRDGLLLAGLIVGQFLVSPEVLFLCGVFAAVGFVAVTAVGWRQVRGRAAHALPALGLAFVVAGGLLAYPVWFGLAGPQAVTGVLFAIAPIAGVPFTGVVLPGAYGAPATDYIRFSGYLGHNGPPPDYLGGGLLFAAAASLVLARRRALTWLLLLLGVVAFWFTLGSYPRGAPGWFGHVWLPWHELSKLPLFKEILPGQIAPFVVLFVAFLVAVGLDALYVHHRPASSWLAVHRRAVTVAATASVVLLAVPVFATYDVPAVVGPVKVPTYVRTVAPTLPSGTVMLTVPFPISGVTQPMLWQAVDDMRFDLAGAALKTPGPHGGPVGKGAPGSARRIMSDLTIPRRARAERHAGADRRSAAGAAHMEGGAGRRRGASRDPVYATGFLTMVLGVAPTDEAGAQVWTLQHGIAEATPAVGASLSSCREGTKAVPRAGRAAEMAHCVLAGAGRA